MEANVLTEAISEALKDSTYTKSREGSRRLPADIRQRIVEKRNARKRARTTMCPRDVHTANRLAKDLKIALDEHRRTMWRDRILSLSTEDLSLWKISKNLKKKNIASVSRPLHGPGGVVYTAAERAEVHAEHLAGVFGGNPSGDLRRRGLRCTQNIWRVCLGATRAVMPQVTSCRK
ncbi:hypothetical protein QE152_g33644 [Popillia japonica]|uniref:Uncharacterized protein n=1 Tax=Popillia japonica TaxID=7064 RepID=A0AAW1IW33_POPJA